MRLRTILSESKYDNDSVIKIIARSSSKNVRRIEYKTFDEALCDASLFVLSKGSVESELEAFITLFSHHLHFYQEWSISETTLGNSHLILRNWLLPEIEKHSYKALTPKQLHEEIDWIVVEMHRILNDENPNQLRASYPERWGVFMNGIRMSNEMNLDDFAIGEFVSGIGLQLEWNSVDIFYETPDSYVLLSWGIGA